MAFRRFYHVGKFYREYTSEDFGRLLLRTIVPTTVIHLVALSCARFWMAELSSGYGFVIESLVGPGADTVSRLKVWPDGQSFANAYLGLIILSGLAGYGFQYAIRFFGLDRRIKIFKFQNYRHYLLRGPSEVKFISTDFTFVQVLVSTSKGDVLYDGILVDYELRSSNELEHLVLTGTRRRQLSADRQEASETSENLGKDARYYSIIGDATVIPASQIKNYNLRYINDLELTNPTETELRVSVQDADGDITSAAVLDQDKPTTITPRP